MLSLTPMLVKSILHHKVLPNFTNQKREARMPRGDLGDVETLKPSFPFVKAKNSSSNESGMK